jgi:uncharacterized protein
MINKINKKRVFIIHGWEGKPDGNDWLPWLKKELEDKNFEVVVPAMPNTDEPKINVWVPFLSDLVGKPDKNTYLVGHSMGCQTILRYLETLEGKKVGGAVFVAGFFNLINLSGDKEREIAKPWLEIKINLEKVIGASDKFIAIFSDNDPYVPIGDREIFERQLGAEIIIERDKSHFDEGSGVLELPVALESVIKMSKDKNTK